ncbi:hypothetical protein VM1G_03693 [Cytospora mali]|uniref:Rhodopsin domain-containing protein n=1 Tax=Cytospora mali TaxID=578113 RepID=A0A194VWQ7_CYTMA|nr:hypothetical protein VM1G_03693 [Valsa mali]
MLDGFLPSNVTPQGFLAAEIVILITPPIFVAIRVFSNVHQNGRPFFDDYLDWQNSVYNWANVRVANTYMTVLSLFFAKVAIVLMYKRLFGVYKWLRYICYAILTIDLVVHGGSLIAISVACTPFNQSFLFSWLERCDDTAYLVDMINAVLAVFNDVVIFVLPLPAILRLNMPHRKRLGLVAVFMFGLLGFCASGTNLYFLIMDWSPDVTPAINVGAELSQNTEKAVAIIVGCIPSVYAFWRNQAVNMPIFSKLMNAFPGWKLRSTKPRGRPVYKSQQLEQQASDHRILRAVEPTYIALGEVTDPVTPSSV